MESTSASKTRRILVFVAGMLGLCLLAPPLKVAFNEPVVSLFWHMRHQGSVSFQGHTFQLPSLWRPGDASADKLELRRALYNGGHELLTIESVGDEMNQEQASAWQQERLTALNRGVSSIQDYIPESVDSGTMQFVCIHQVQLGFAATMFCRVPGTNWHVSLVGDQNALKESIKIMRDVR
jgi:hypothetical protein